ncbi:hypothetical protein Q7P37_002690 [Cladosporium fusiforme]
MNALVGYGSSDEEEDDDASPPRPAKIAKLDDIPPEHLTAPLKSTASWNEVSQKSSRLTDHSPAPTAHPEARIETHPLKASTLNPPPPPAEDVPQRPATLPAGPAPAAGPTAPGPPLDDNAATVTPPNPTTPFSPYTYTRQRLRELTMPPIPNFSIPDAPPAPPQNSEEAATLASTTKQFERFLELKSQGVHFNARLQTSSSLRNPSLLPKLLAFAGFEVREGEVYESSLEGEGAVPPRWPEDCYVESLVRGNERRERKRGAEREGVEFVPARRE